MCDMSGAWGHVDEAWDVWVGQHGAWAGQHGAWAGQHGAWAGQHGAWAWCAQGHDVGVEMSLEPSSMRNGHGTCRGYGMGC